APGPRPTRRGDRAPLATGLARAGPRGPAADDRVRERPAPPGAPTLRPTDAPPAFPAAGRAPGRAAQPSRTSAESTVHRAARSLGVSPGRG
ncbi:hypothetical protein ABTX79_06630, partial [Streptomyces sp. NPDC096153]